MTWADALPYVATAISTLIIHGKVKGTDSKVQLESSKIQLGVSSAAESVKVGVVHAISAKPAALNIDYGDRLTALERKQDLIIENLRRPPGTPWKDEITRIPKD